MKKSTDAPTASSGGSHCDPNPGKTCLGHEHLIGEKSPLRRLIEKDAGLSFILWGPPGAGKTTIARIVASITQSEFHEISAVNAGVADIRKIIERAKDNWAQSKKRTVRFCSSTKFIASTNPSRMLFCLMSRTGRFA